MTRQFTALVHDQHNRHILCAMSPTVETLLRHGLLLVLPLLCALLLRWARCPGWPVVGGLMAGILLGPPLLGGLSPHTHERLFQGAVQERITCDGWRIALSDPSLPPAKAGQFQLALAAAEEEWRKAKWADQRPLRCHAATIVALTMLGAGLLAIRKGEHRSGFTTPISIGLWSAALPGALAYVAMTRWWGYSTAQAALTAAAVAVGPWALLRVDREAADDAEVGGARLIQTAGRLASLPAIALAVWAIWSQLGAEGLLWSAPLAAIIPAWLIPTSRPARPAILESKKKVPDPFFPEKGSGYFFGAFFSREALGVVLVPALAACVAVKIDLFAHFAIWPVIVIPLLSGDVRWIGALLGAMLPGGRRWLRTMRLIMGSSACGPTQLAIAAIAVHTNAIPETIPLALLLGAAYIEITVPLRRHMTRRLAETEQEIANIDSDI